MEITRKTWFNVGTSKNVRDYALETIIVQLMETHMLNRRKLDADLVDI